MGGADLPTVKELLGRKNPGMAIRYAHLSDQHKREKAEPVDSHNLVIMEREAGKVLTDLVTKN